jgi:hypothetical protein
VIPAKRSGARHPPANRAIGAFETAGAIEQGASWRPPIPRLLVYKVVEKVRPAYLSAVRRFVRFARKEGDSLETPGLLDRAGTWFLDHCCFNTKEGQQVGRNLRAGITHLKPGLKGSLGEMSRALETWDLLEGNVERESPCALSLEVW